MRPGPLAPRLLLALAVLGLAVPAEPLVAWVLAAGLAGQMARFLIQADVLPGLLDPLWDTSWLLGTQSAVGSFLQVLIGYDPRPSATQMLFYGATLLLILAGAKLARPRQLKV